MGEEVDELRNRIMDVALSKGKGVIGDYRDRNGKSRRDLATKYSARTINIV